MVDAAERRSPNRRSDVALNRDDFSAARISFSAEFSGELGPEVRTEEASCIIGPKFEPIGSAGRARE